MVLLSALCRVSWTLRGIREDMKQAVNDQSTVHDVQCRPENLRNGMASLNAKVEAMMARLQLKP